MTARASESGLTLLEVLVALGIVAMAIGLGLPMLQRGTSPLQTSAAARQIVAALREARTAAITENRVTVFWLNPGAGSYGYGERSFALPKPNGSGSLSLALHTTEEQRVRSAQPGKADTGTIRFFPGGGSTGGGVTLDDGRSQIVVSIDWLSGQIRMAAASPAASPSRGNGHAAR